MSAEARRAAMIEDADGWRGPPPGALSGATPQEWQHFVLFGEGWHLLFNLSLLPGGRGRVVTLLGGDGWRGDVFTCAHPRFSPGRVDAVFEGAGMRFRGGRYEIWQHGEGVRLEAVLTPVSTPSLTHHIRFGRGAHVSWCLVPRLFASGWIEAAGRRIAFDRCLAYHDHNWGRFSWGGDFSWDWGALVPDDIDSPWTVIFARMCDRARHRTTATSLFLLKDGEHARYFRNAEVRFEAEGTLESRPARRIPPAAALLAPDHDRDVPRLLRFEASRDGESLRGEVESRSRGQVLVPAESDLRRVVRMSEVMVRARVEGHCAGEPVRLEGQGILEVVRG